MRVRTLVARPQQVTGSLSAPDALLSMPGEMWSKETAPLLACSHRHGLALADAHRS